ncbi:MAG: hypothetical protein E5X69_21880, partial [Mesorhizobium sp.]
MRRFAGFFSCLLLMMPLASANGLGRQWQAGQYSFSDELGGFLIRSVSGAGTRSDPAVISEELE